MRSVLLCVRRMPESGSLWTRVRNLVLTIGLAMLASGVLAVQYGRAQATEQNCSSNGDSPEACAPNGEAQPPSAGESEQGAEKKNCTSDDGTPVACASSADSGEAQTPTDGGNSDQGPSQPCGAEGTPEACGPNSEAETPTASQAQDSNSAGNGANSETGAQGAGFTPEEQKCIRACGDSSASESCLRSCVQAGNGKASPQNAGAQGPPQNNSRQPRGALVTPPGPRSQRPQSEPQEIHEPSPYKNLPSLYDLYTQIPPAGGKLRRFGSDAFVVGSGNANELPMDLPAGADYVLGPGDELIVNMWGGQSNRLDRTVDRQGQIELPEAGTIMINGMTIAQAQTAIQQVLSTQFRNEQVEISLGRLRTVRVYVVGDVQRPGAYDVSSLSTPLSALYAAGGPTSRGSLRILKQYRGDHLVREIDLYDFLLKGVRSDVEHLLPGDTLLVPPFGPQVTVEGMVHRPAIYELNGEKTLNQVIDLAGGVLRTASLKQINVARIVAQERRTMVSLQLPDDPAEVAKKLADFPVQGGDDVVNLADSALQPGCDFSRRSCLPARQISV